MRRRASGFTLLELIIAMVVFGIFLWILIQLTGEMRKQEKKLPINFMKHPQVSAVVARLRKDVLDADSSVTSPYLSEWPPPPQNPEYRNGRQVLIIRTIEPDGRKVVVWDFSKRGVALRRSYDVGIPSDWLARGLPEDIENIQFGAQMIAGRGYAVQLTAKDKKGRIAIDQIFLPRAHR